MKNSFIHEKQMAKYGLLMRLSSRRLPVTITSKEEIDLVRAYQAAGLVVADFQPAAARTDEQVVVRAVTSDGDIALKLLHDNPRRSAPVKTGWLA